MFTDVTHQQEYSKVESASEFLYTLVDVFGMQPVIFQTQKQSTSGSSQLEIWDDISKLFAHILDVFKHRIESGMD